MEHVIVRYGVGQIALILFAYLLIVFYVGFRAYKAKIDDSSTEFFATKWTTGWVGISFSIAATMASAGYVMGTLGVFYNNPSALTGYFFAVLFAPWFMWIMGRRMWLLGRLHGFVTFTEFIGDFFRSKPLQVIVSILITVTYAPYFSIMLQGPAMLMESLTGGQIPYTIGVLTVAIIAVGYTYFGGMRGVIWTDILQASIMYLLFLVAVPVAIMSAGGIVSVINTVPEGKLLYPGTLLNWQLVISWFVIVGLAQAGRPDRGFRILAAKSIKTIKQASIAAVVLLGAWAVIPLLTGWSFNVSMPGITPTDMIMPVGLSAYAPWLMPFFLIAVWAGGMSTLDSGLISASAMITRDVYLVANPKATNKQMMTCSRIVILLGGVFGIIVALTEPPYLWYFSAAAAAIAMQWVPPIMFALYWKRANTQAAWVGLIGGIITACIFQYIIPCPWPGGGGPAIMGFAFNIPAFVIVALLTPPMPKEHMDKYQGFFDKKTMKELADQKISV